MPLVGWVEKTRGTWLTKESRVLCTPKRGRDERITLRHRRGFERADSSRLEKASTVLIGGFIEQDPATKTNTPRNERTKHSTRVNKKMLSARKSSPTQSRNAATVAVAVLPSDGYNMTAHTEPRLFMSRPRHAIEPRFLPRERLLAETSPAAATIPRDSCTPNPPPPQVPSP